LDNVSQEGVTSGRIQFARVPFPVKDHESHDPAAEGFDPRFRLTRSSGRRTELIE
jgi:hypothetical protein